MTKTIGMTKAREGFKKIGDEVQYQRESYIVSRNGEPAFAIVPLQILTSWEERRQTLLDIMDKVQTNNTDLDPDDVMNTVLHVQEEVRNLMKAEDEAGL
jgi:prevent-host-death family protein